VALAFLLWLRRSAPISEPVGLDTGTINRTLWRFRGSLHSLIRYLTFSRTSNKTFFSSSSGITVLVMPTESEDIGSRLQIFSGVFIPLQVIAVALRFYSRWLVVGQSHPLEDALVVVALISQLILDSVCLGKWSAMFKVDKMSLNILL
jgi:hypothetical protein